MRYLLWGEQKLFIVLFTVFVVILALILYKDIFSTESSEASSPSTRVHVFYYPWYGNLTTDGKWIHWQQNSHIPPDDVAANFYPQLGAYSGASQTIIAQHMDWIAQSGVGVLVYSWEGQGSLTDKRATLVLDEALKKGLKVAWHIEPYSGRTASSVESDIKYIYDRYGSHATFLRVSRSTKYGNATVLRGVFYVFESSGGAGAIPAADWRIVLDRIHADPTYNAIVLGETSDACFIDGCGLEKESHFDGLYTYDGLQYDGSTFADINTRIKNRNSIFSPSVAAGYVANRATADTRVKPRYDGARTIPYTYDSMWDYVIKAKTEWVSVTSFNEWHEGSQIEPAVAKTIPGFTYEDYNDFDPNADSELYLKKTSKNVQAYLIAVGDLTSGTVTANASKDTFVDSANPSINYGNLTTLQIDNAPSIKRALLRFQISEIPEGASVSSSTLRLFVANASAQAGSLYRVEGSWEEATIIWDNAPVVGVKIADFPGSATVGTWVEADLKSVISGNGTFDFYITSSASDAVYYNSREAGSNLPTLTIAWSVVAPTPIPSPPPQDPVIVAVGDIACGAESGSAQCKQMQTSDLALQINPNAVLTLGDTQYEFGQYSNFINFYDPSWGRVKDKNYPAVGNHEYGDSVGSKDIAPDCDVLIPGDPSSYACGYFDYFNGKGNFSGRAGDRGKGYYAFDVGRWRLYAINSNCERGGAPGCTTGSSQEQWLRNDLAVNPRECAAMFMHHPFTTSDKRAFDTDALKPIWQAFYDAGGDLALVGHSHFYERFAMIDPNKQPDSTFGIRQIIVGTGGRNVYDPDNDNDPTNGIQLEANSEIYNGKTFGVLKLTLHPTSYDWGFVPIAGQSFQDTGRESCHGMPPKETVPPSIPTNLTASALAGNRVSLTWTASTDNVGVAGYKIFRDGIQIANAFSTSYLDTTTKPNTSYSFYVTAFDIAGNNSSPSNTVTVTTPSFEAFVFSPSADSYVDVNFPTTNFGSDVDLKVDNSPFQHILLKFSVSGIGARKVTGAKLRLFNTNDSAKGGDFFSMRDTTWGENTVTWNNAPMGDTLLASLGNVVKDSWYEIDISRVITGDGVYSFKITSPSSDGAWYASKEDEPPPNAAELMVTISLLPTLSALDEPHLFLDDPEMMRLLGTNFTPGDDFKFRLKLADVVKLEAQVEAKDSTTIEFALSIDDEFLRLTTGFYTMELERITDSLKLTHQQQLLITKLGDLWAPTDDSHPDHDRDGKIDIFDVSRLFSKWGSTKPEDLQEADINPGPGGISSGKIDIYDANLMMRNWFLE